MDRKYGIDKIDIMIEDLHIFNYFFLIIQVKAILYSITPLFYCNSDVEFAKVPENRFLGKKFFGCTFY